MHATAWIHAENIIQVKARHKRPHGVRFHFYETSRIDKCPETESRLVVAQGSGGWRVKGTGASFEDDENVLKLIMVMATQHCEYSKNHLIVYFI